jgi:hypothetical protein
MMNKSLILAPHRKMRREVLRFAGRFARPVSTRAVAAASGSANGKFEVHGNLPA